MSVTYSDSELRNLVEENIAQQKSEFTLKGVCSYILFWAVEDGKTAEGKKLIESDELQQSDQERAKQSWTQLLQMDVLYLQQEGHI